MTCTKPRVTSLAIGSTTAILGLNPCRKTRALAKKFKNFSESPEWPKLLGNNPKKRHPGGGGHLRSWCSRVFEMPTTWDMAAKDLPSALSTRARSTTS